MPGTHHPNFRTQLRPVHLLSVLPKTSLWKRSPFFPLGSAFFKRGTSLTLPRLGFRCPMPIPSRPRPDRRQMDGVDHPIALEADNALRRAPPRDRWDFPKNADANSSQPGTRRSSRAQGLSSRSTESRVFALQTGSDVDRTVARALPLVRKTSGRIAGQSRATESETRLGRELIDYSEFCSKLIFTS